MSVKVWEGLENNCWVVLGASVGLYLALVHVKDSRQDCYDRTKRTDQKTFLGLAFYYYHSMIGFFLTGRVLFLQRWQLTHKRTPLKILCFLMHSVTVILQYLLILQPQYSPSAMTPPKTSSQRLSPSSSPDSTSFLSIFLFHI